LLNYRRTTQFKKDYKQQIRRGKDNNKIDAIISDLINERPLDPVLKDHPLQGDWQDFRELHIEPDWLLIYQVAGNEIFFVRTGTHSDLYDL
jgi:mRNA interferase YafQ